MKKFYLAIIIALVFIILVCLLLTASLSTSSDADEGFETMPVAYKKGTTTLINGYFLVDSSNMMPIPNGYVIDPANQSNIIPKTAAAINDLALRNTDVPPPPTNGGMIPDGYYLVSNTSLGALMPSMMPKVSSVSLSPLNVVYSVGYQPEPLYYSAKFPVQDGPTVPPAKIYYVDPSHTMVSFLKPNTVADTDSGFGFKSAIRTFASGGFDTTKSYRDVSNNYDVQFHDSIEDIQKQSGTDLSFGEVRVRDQCGNVIILPRAKTQGDILYNEPGSFVFGSSSYIPNYEDSIYLSRTTHQSTLSPYVSTSAPAGVCENAKDSSIKTETACLGMNKDVCASSSCCVLLGGSKCVAGNENGPTFRSNYSDPMLRNKDRYYYQGKCYGNC